METKVIKLPVCSTAATGGSSQGQTSWCREQWSICKARPGSNGRNMQQQRQKSVQSWQRTWQWQGSGAAVAAVMMWQSSSVERQQEPVMAGSEEPSQAAALISNVPVRSRRGDAGRQQAAVSEEGGLQLFQEAGRKGTIFFFCTPFLRKQCPTKSSTASKKCWCAREEYTNWQFDMSVKTNQPCLP